MRIKSRLIAIYYIIICKSFYTITNRGGIADLPFDRPAIEVLQDEFEMMDSWLEQMHMDLILSERD